MKPKAVPVAALRAALDELSTPVAIVDATGRVAAVNGAWRNGNPAWGQCAVGDDFLAAVKGLGAHTDAAGLPGVQELLDVIGDRRKDATVAWSANGASAPSTIRLRASRLDAPGGYVLIALEEGGHSSEPDSDLRQRASEEQALSDFGQRALAGLDPKTLFDEAVRLVARTLDLPFVALFERRENGDEALLRAGVGWRAGCIGGVSIAAGTETQIGRTLVAGESLIVEDQRSDGRFEEPAWLREHGVGQGITVAIAGERRPFGVLAAWSGARRRLGAEALRFIEAVARKLAVALARKEAEAAVEASERRFRALIENSMDAIALLDAKGAMLYASPAAVRLLGYSTEELLGMQGIGWIHPDDAAASAERFAQTLAGTCTTGRCRIRHRDGSWRWIEAVSHNWLADPNVRAIVTNFRDITDRQAAVEAQAASEERYQRLLQGLDAIVWEAEPATGRVLFISQAAETIVGYPVARWLEEPGFWMRCVDPEDRNATLAFYQAAIASAEPDHNVEYRLLAADGRRVWVRDRFHVSRDAAGRPGYLRGVMVDTTSRKLHERKVTVLLEMARDISGTIEMSELLDRVQRRTARAVGCDAVITYFWDGGAARFRAAGHFGIPAELLPDSAAIAFQPPAALLDLIGEGQTLVVNEGVDLGWMAHEHLRAMRLAGLVAAPLVVRGHLLGIIVGIRVAEGRPFLSDEVALFNGIAWQLAVAVEAAELYRAQLEEARVSSALARVGREVITSLDQPDLLERLCRLTTEAIGCDFSYALLWRPEENAYVPAAAFGHSGEEWELVRAVKMPSAILGGLIERLERRDVVRVEVRAGSTHPLAILAAEYGVTTALHVAIRRGTDVIGLLAAGYRGRAGTFNGGQERIARGVAHLASMAFDHMELVSALERANQLKADFVATMSHELRTPLHVIMGYHDLLVEGIFGELNPDQSDVIERIEKSAQGLLELVDATLDVGRIEAGRIRMDVQDVNLADLIGEVMAEVAEPRKKPEVVVEWHADPALCRLRTDPVKVKVILKNLIGNAVKFTEQGRVTVRAEPRENGIEMRVTDSGIGIPLELQEIIFEPFRQGDGSITREYGGVGLGLYVVRRFVDLLDGRIDVQSEMGAGSTFRVWLPHVLGAPYPIGPPVGTIAAGRPN